MSFYIHTDTALPNINKWFNIARHLFTKLYNYVKLQNTKALDVNTLTKMGTKLKSRLC